MSTSYIYRLLLIYPNSEDTSITNFITTNFDPSKADYWADSILSASGNSPATHFWTSFVANKADTLTWINRYFTPPIGLLDGDRATQRAWFAANKSVGGIYLDICFNDEGERSDTDAALAATNLKRIQVAL